MKMIGKEMANYCIYSPLSHFPISESGGATLTPLARHPVLFTGVVSLVSDG
jgi:hypothetical protein